MFILTMCLTCATSVLTSYGKIVRDIIQACEKESRSTFTYLMQSFIIFCATLSVSLKALEEI